MNPVQYIGEGPNTGRKRSGGIWADCPWDDIVRGDKPGVWDFQDFSSGGKITQPTTEAALVGLPINGFSGSTGGTTITYDVLKNGGGGLILSTTTANEGNVIRSAQAPYQISANLGPFWFEARIKLAAQSLLTTECSFLLGMMDTTAASATAPITMTSGVIADVNFVGFHKPSANTTKFNASYRANGVTAVVVNTGIGALVADTYVNLGFKFSPTDKNRLSFFVNNVKQTSVKVVPDNTGTDFPADVALGWVLAMSTVAGGDNTVTIDKLRLAQLLAT